MAAADDHNDDEQKPANPFAGTPMEQMFAAFGDGQMPDLNALMGQMQRMFKPHEGTIDVNVVKDVARHVVAAPGAAPSPTSSHSGAVPAAVRFADPWLNQAPEIPPARQRQRRGAGPS